MNNKKGDTKRFKDHLRGNETRRGEHGRIASYRRTSGRES